MSSVLFLEKRLRTDKIGFLYLSRVMKDAGHTVDLIQSDLDDIEGYLRHTPVDFIMYSVMTGEHMWFLNKNKELKQKFHFKSVMGGPHFTFFPEQGLEDDSVDYIVQGPGEQAVLDILDGKTDRFVIGHLPDVNRIPHPDRSILYKYDEFGKARMKRFIASRYCLFSCKYCFNHLYKRLYKDEKGMLTQRVNVDKMIDEILEVKQKYGLEYVYFNDDDFPGDHAWLQEFCEKYKERVKMNFCGSMRASSVNREVVKMMADAGCDFMNIALESANPTTQVFLRRGFVTNEQVKEACSACKEFGIKVRLQNMIGLPVDDPLQDALDTLKFNVEVGPTDSWAAVFQPFPKTDLWQESLNRGLITKDTQARNFYEGTPLMIADADKINRLHKWWFFIVQHKLPMSLVNVLLDMPLTPELEKRLQDVRWDIAKGLLYGM